MNRWQKRLDRILGVMMRLSFVAIIVAMCLNVSTIYADEVPTTGYMMTVYGVHTPTGEHGVIGTAYSDTRTSCAYNMGLIAATFWNEKRVGQIVSAYTDIGKVQYLSFFSVEGTVYIHMECSAIESVA